MLCTKYAGMYVRKYAQVPVSTLHCCRLSTIPLSMCLSMLDTHGPSWTPSESLGALFCLYTEELRSTFVFFFLPRLHLQSWGPSQLAARLGILPVGTLGGSRRLAGGFGRPSSLLSDGRSTIWGEAVGVRFFSFLRALATGVSPQQTLARL